MSNIDRFVSYLESLANREDRASLAKLRRSLGKPPGTVVDALPVVVPFLPKDTREHWAYFLVGSLYALHPENTNEGNMGDAYRGFGDHESAEKRFTALLDCHADELGEHLRHTISLSRSKNIPINYRQLLRDILHWSHPDKWVQLQWARNYWNPSKNTNDEPVNNNKKESQAVAAE